MDPIFDVPTKFPSALEAKIGRRKFLKIITAAAASIGLSTSATLQMVEAATLGLKPSVIWLHFPSGSTSRSARAAPSPC